MLKNKADENRVTSYLIVTMFILVVLLLIDIIVDKPHEAERVELHASFNPRTVTEL